MIKNFVSAMALVALSVQAQTPTEIKAEQEALPASVRSCPSDDSTANWAETESGKAAFKVARLRVPKSG